MRVTFNRSHFGVWIKVGMWWLTLIAMALVFGPHARTDELLFAFVGLPLMVLVPYAAGTFLIACVKALGPWPTPRWRRRRLLASDRRLCERPSGTDRGETSYIPPV